MYLINQLGRLCILEIWNLEYYVIFFVYFFTEKINFLLVNKEKKNQLYTNWLEELKKSKQILRNIRDSEIRENPICPID